MTKNGDALRLLELKNAGLEDGKEPRILLLSCKALQAVRDTSRRSADKSGQLLRQQPYKFVPFARCQPLSTRGAAPGKAVQSVCRVQRFDGNRLFLAHK